MPIEIRNLLHALNLDRPDIAELPEGATISCNVSTLRRVAAYLRKQESGQPVGMTKTLIADERDNVWLDDSGDEWVPIRANKRESLSQHQLAEMLTMQRLTEMTYSSESIAEMQREASIAWCSSVAEALWYIETLSKIEVGSSEYQDSK